MGMDEKQTVKEYIQDWLAVYDFTWDELQRVTEYCIKECDKYGVANRLELITKDGNKILLKDCWDTDISNYDRKEELDWLASHMTKFYVVQWCVNVIHSLK